MKLVVVVFRSHDFFFNLSWHVLVVNPADVKKGDKQKYQKTKKRVVSHKLSKGLLIFAIETSVTWV